MKWPTKPYNFKGSSPEKEHALFSCHYAKELGMHVAKIKWQRLPFRKMIERSKVFRFLQILILHMLDNEDFKCFISVTSSCFLFKHSSNWFRITCSHVVTFLQMDIVSSLLVFEMGSILPLVRQHVQWSDQHTPVHLQTSASQGWYLWASSEVWKAPTNGQETMPLHERTSAVEQYSKTQENTTCIPVRL